jgi:hypothetical protein
VLCSDDTWSQSTGKPDPVSPSDTTESETPPAFVDPEELLLSQIWGEVDEMSACIPRDTGQCKGCEDESDSDEDPENYSRIAVSHPVMAVLPCGDIHLCKWGKPCPYLVSNDDRVMVCEYTGVEHGPEHTDEYFDLNGGTGKKSGDPDQNCGEILHGKYKRADPVIASRMAFDASHLFDDSECVEYIPSAHSKDNAVPVKRTQKRGALCVGEDPDESQSSKKMRCSKRNIDNCDTRSHLHAEAESVLCKMVDHKRAASFKSKAPPGRVDRKCAPADPRMCDEKFVFNKSLQKYLKNCAVSGVAPSLDTIHNLSLMAQTVSAKAREQRDSSLETDSIRTAKFRMLCSSLIVSLWSAACRTPYMESARRGSDAYRPFVCGVLYAFKRGVSLDNGTVLVPKYPQLADALPVIRGTGGNKLAKTLHSSSHRGMCTLSRCIASVPREQQSVAFADVARVASQLSNATFSKWDI